MLDLMATDRDSSAEPSWAGAAMLRPGILAFRGIIAPTDRHAHHAVQVVLVDATVTVIDHAGDEHRCSRLVIPADAPHRISAGAPAGVVVFLAPEAPAGAAAHRLGRTTWSQPTVATGVDLYAPLSTVADSVVAHFGAPKPEVCRHPSVTDAAQHAQAMLGDGPVRTRDLAARVGLSADRLTHLFTSQMGLPVRRYVLWLRLITALRTVADGSDLTMAAHAAGFADSAHLTRTCRSMFGLTPSALSRNIEVTAREV